MIISKSKTMKTIFIYRMKAMQLSIIILILVLSPIISYGTISQNSNILSDLEVQYEKSEVVIFENWMTDVNTWFVEVSGTDSEEELETEEWMFDVYEKSWHDEMVEEELVVEEWMLNIDSISLRSWNDEESIEVESWMLDPASWLGNK